MKNPFFSFAFSIKTRVRIPGSNSKTSLAFTADGIVGGDVRSHNSPKESFENCIFVVVGKVIKRQSVRL